MSGGGDRLNPRGGFERANREPFECVVCGRVEDLSDVEHSLTGWTIAKGRGFWCPDCSRMVDLGHFVPEAGIE